MLLSETWWTGEESNTHNVLWTATNDLSARDAKSSKQLSS